jgi:hypothetical protein
MCELTEARAESVCYQATPADDLEATQQVSVGPAFACPTNHAGRRQRGQRQRQVDVAILKLSVACTSAPVQKQQVSRGTVPK